MNRPIIPVETLKKSDYRKKNRCFVISGVIGVLVMLVCDSKSGGGVFTRLLYNLGILFGGILLFASLLSLWLSNSYSDEQYRHDVKIATDKAKMNEKILQQRPQNERALRQWSEHQVTIQARLDEAQILLRELYSVNIVPAKYRNIYAAYYLYEYFNSCRENDLDKIIQTMLLDEIKQQLSRIIEQNERIIINQRMQLALQEENNQMQAMHHKELMQQLIRMESNQELQLDYQNMLVGNQAVTNFFLAADYLRKS